MAHPFWRSRFLLDRPADVAQLRASEIAAVVIDLSRGIGLDRAESAGAPPPPPPDPAWSQDRPPAVLKAEREQARKAIEHARDAARDIYDRAGNGLPIDAGAVAPIVAEIADCVARNPAMFLDMARLKSRDEYTYLHSVSVCGLMVNLAREIGLDDESARAMGLAGLLHDVGKTSVPAEVLNKPGRLDDAEFALIKRHPEQGHALLLGGEGINQEALDVALMHHEKLDGSGYPFGLKGEAISLAARMGAICDVYDALTSDRVYKDRWTPLKAVTEMHGWAGHFDPRLLFAFFRSVGVAPTGYLVRMASGRLGVALPDGMHGRRSKIRAFYSTVTRRPVPLEDIFRGLSDRALGPEDPADWGFTNWDAAVHELMAGHRVMPG